MRAAVIGVGRMGRRHIPAAIKAGCEIAGIYDVRPESLAEARREHGLSEGVVFDDLDRLYSVARPDCLVIATTADSHAPLTIQAAERGVRCVLVEKPMAVSLEQCDRMIDICASRGARLAVNHQMRFMEQYTEPKRLGSSDAFGGITSMTVVGGNFGMGMNGTHYFEAFRFVTGEPITSLSAWFSREPVSNPRGAQFEDRAGCLRAVTAGGKRFYMDVSADQGHGVRVTYGCRYGQITVDELAGDLRTVEREEQYRSLPTTRYGMPAAQRHATIQPAEVIDTSAAVLKALLTGRDNVSGEDGRRAVEVLVAAYRSAANGGAAVDVDGLPRGEVFPWA